MSNEANSSFARLKDTPIPSLNINVETYQHNVTGTFHYHLASENKENVFLVALRTVPTDSKGVAHILEHTALCGSEKYPVRDPFFMMIRRSLNTFMNAFTSSDWTAYPFASQNKKDFSNLLDVYLDAVFFSTLDKLDFAQEGHRLEFEEMENTDSPLVYKGVVYNEMKGAMSSPVSQLWQTLTKHLFPTTTYHYNSGGEPDCIPDLSYDELIAFYKTHYHPSNAIFLTYGDIPAVEHQQKFENQVLSRFQKLDKEISVPKEQRYSEPQRFEGLYGVEQEEDLKDKTHVVMGWLLNESADLENRLKANLLSSVLLDNSSSPLQYALENTKLGQAPSQLCGLEDSNREMVFMCGLEGCNETKVDDVENLILDVLKEVADKGVDQSRVDSALHQLELSQKEITGGGYPYGLQLILDMLPVAIHRNDPVSALDIEKALEKLREESADPAFFKKLVKEFLLDNTHRVCLSLKPDLNVNAQKEKETNTKLEQIKQGLSDDEKNDIVTLAKSLQARQEQIDDESILPKVGLEDIPDEMYIAEGERTAIESLPVSVYKQGTNGIVYEQLVIELPKLDDEQLDLLPIYTRCLTELGSAGRTYLETQALMDKVTGGVSAYSTVRTTVDELQDSEAYLIISGKALVRNHNALSDFLRETLFEVRFDELDRIKELVSQMRARRESSITGNGHGLAMLASASGMSPVAKLKNRTGGLPGIKSIKKLDDSLSDKEALQALAEKLKSLHDKVCASPIQVLVVGEEQSTNDMLKNLKNKKTDAVNEGKWDQLYEADKSNFESFDLVAENESCNQYWVTNTQINFCSKAFPAVASGHEDSAALLVLGSFLKNGFLHRVIREQGGAYGGGAGYDSDSGSFRFYSYRDPRLLETLEDFDKSIDWMLNTEHDAEKLEEAIMGVVSGFDKPSSPAGEAKNAFHSALFGRTPEQRQAFRKKILKVTIDDLKRVTQTYLKQGKASQAVLSNQATLDQMGDKIEMEVCHL
ncbi:MAG: insulinase family protein [Gammaproteobacteria bacterium]|nr:insulinase family protein [Gammaproteobacteria bacterium]